MNQNSQTVCNVTFAVIDKPCDSVCSKRFGYWHGNGFSAGVPATPC